jgi:hypothetical protein
MNDFGALLLQIGAGVGLAACAGLRAFLPLLATGVAARAGWITLGDRFDWLASGPALVVFGVAVGVELLGDKIPVVDHALDLIQIVVKPAAGAILFLAVTTDLGPLPASVLGLLVGGATSGAVHVAKAKARLLSTGLSAGLLNPFVSIAEDLLAIAGTATALVIPLLALAVVVTTAIFLVLLALLGRTLVSRAS